MAEPFTKEKNGYGKLKEEQLAALKAERIEIIKERLNSSDVNFTKYITLEAPLVKNPNGIGSLDSLGNAKSLLAKDPYSKIALNKMASFFETKKLKRLAAYFQGRLKQIKE